MLSELVGRQLLYAKRNAHSSLAAEVDFFTGSKWPRFEESEGGPLNHDAVITILHRTCLFLRKVPPVGGFTSATLPHQEGPYISSVRRSLDHDFGLGGWSPLEKERDGASYTRRPYPNRVVITLLSVVGNVTTSFHLMRDIDGTRHLDIDKS